MFWYQVTIPKLKTLYLCFMLTFFNDKYILRRPLLVFWVFNNHFNFIDCCWIFKQVYNIAASVDAESTIHQYHYDWSNWLWKIFFSEDFCHRLNKQWLYQRYLQSMSYKEQRKKCNKKGKVLQILTLLRVWIANKVY